MSAAAVPLSGRLLFVSGAVLLTTYLLQHEFFTASTFHTAYIRLYISAYYCIVYTLKYNSYNCYNFYKDYIFVLWKTF